MRRAEVAADGVGLALAAVQEPAGFPGEVVGGAGARGMDVPFDVGIEDFIWVELGAVAGHPVQLDAVGVFGQPRSHGLAAVYRVPVGITWTLRPA